MTREEQAGAPLVAVCVHGAGGGGWEWGVWARVFAAQGIRVHAPDLQAAEGGLVATRFEDYRDQVLAHCRDALPSGCRLVLVGASLGGLLALSAAVQAQASALVLVNPMVPAGLVARAPGESYPAIVRWGRERSLAGTRRSMPDADDAATMYALRRWRDESGAVLEQARNGIAVDPPRCPTLVLSGELDDDVPPTLSRALAVRCAADFERLPQCSHLGPLLGVRAALVAERAASWVHMRCATARDAESATR